MRVFPSVSAIFLGMLSMGEVHPEGNQALEGSFAAIEPILETYCYDCHDDLTTKAGLDLLSHSRDLENPAAFETWVHVHDQIQNGAMPPEDKPQPSQEERAHILEALQPALTQVDQRRQAVQGRSVTRRLNRYEYENALRALLEAPWLAVAQDLPADGTVDLFSKSGAALDVSHVHLQQFLEVGRQALEKAIQAAAHPSETHRYYARDESGMNYINSRARSTTPLIGWETDAAVLTGDKPKSASDDPDLRDVEAVAAFNGPHPAYTRYDFKAMNPPVDGRYRLRFKSYAMAAGKYGFDGTGLDPEVPSPKSQSWYWPNRLDIRRAQRPEPITVYALRESGDTRWLGRFDAQPHPHVVELDVTLRAGDDIRPDAARLVRLRPGWKGNPLAIGDHVPGWALQWMEVEGPLVDTWPPPSYTAVLGDLPLQVKDGAVRALTENPSADARRLLHAFARRAFRGRATPPDTVTSALAVFEEARGLGYDFTDALLTAMSGLMVAPEFLYLPSDPGPLSPVGLAERLAFFLWNSPPDARLREAADLANPVTLRRQTERLLADARSQRFLNAFLDEWLELKEIGATVPDATLYTDYFLDGQLVEAALEETRAFFGALIEDNLPARTLIDADFTFANERLARHYGLPKDTTRPSALMRRVSLPPESPRGGLLTQAAILKVTANGTTTSPVLRGVWVVERLLGREIADPPSGVEAIEPDTRGATTIREQLAKHVETESCAACHLKFDPVGFALESFDVLGGERQRYRALGDQGEPVEGYGMNGHAFTFRLAQPVESYGSIDGEAFDNVRALKQILVKDDRAIARNLVHQWIAYATGATVSFADRDAVEGILDACEPSGYGVRDLLHAVVQSPLFRNK